MQLDFSPVLLRWQLINITAPNIKTKDLLSDVVITTCIISFCELSSISLIFREVFRASIQRFSLVLASNFIELLRNTEVSG